MKFAFFRLKICILILGNNAMDLFTAALIFGLIIFGGYYSRRLIRELENQRVQHMDKRILRAIREGKGE